MTNILGIETTCDETAAAVVQDGRIVLSNIVASQAKLHRKYGGIVPEVASRKHLEALPVVVEEALKKANVKFGQIDAIAVATKPGLPPALSVGYAYASGLALSKPKGLALSKPKGLALSKSKELSLSKNLSLIEVDHLEAHISGIWLVEKGDEIQDIPYPSLCLLVSGGHTQIRLVTNSKTQKILGSTRDDAAGEAFDKVARLLDLGYPGGPIIDKLAREGDEHQFPFPRPMIGSDDFDFSFSGLKTAVRRTIEKTKKEYSQYENNKELHLELTSNLTKDFAASFQEAVVDVLVSKTIKAAEELGIEIILMAGGVSANTRLQDKLARECHDLGFEFYYPKLEYCLDNAAMIAGQGFAQLSDA